MLRLTLAQMRRSAGRLLAAGVAIVVGTAFIAATFLGASLMRDTAYAAMTASVGDADVVVSAGDDELRPADLTAVRDAPGTALADGVLEISTPLTANARSDFARLRSTPSPGLETVELVEGTFPTGPGQVAITEASAERLGVALGDRLDATPQVFLGIEDGVVAVEAPGLRLVGILADPVAIFAEAAIGVVTADQLAAWAGEAGVEPTFSEVLVVAEDGTSAEALAETLGDVLPGAFVLTGTELAEQRTAEVAGTTLVFTVLVLAFAAVAMFVAAIVITNTFQVLVAQRTRTLALLRCVGATKAQVRRSVLLEALLLGLVAGAGGLGAGLALAQATLWVLGAQDLGLPLPEALHVTPAVVLAPVLTGAVVTVLAALAPARAATRVAPLAALRPADAPDPRGRSRARLVLAVLAVLSGAACLVAGARLATAADVDADLAIQGGLALGILGGVVSFTGVMVGAVFVVPTLVRGLGGLLTRADRGGTARLATANAVRNPRRTAATATALVIGVTLVTLMSTGAVSVRASLDSVLDAEFPADVVVSSTTYDETGAVALADAHVEAVASAPGVAATAAGTTALVTITGDGGTAEVEALGLEPAAAAAVLRGDLLDGVGPGTVAVSAYLARLVGIEPGDTVTVAPAGDATPPGTSLRAVVRNGGSELLLDAATLAAITPDSRVTTLLVRLDADGDHAAVISGLQDRITEADAARVGDGGEPAPSPYVVGAAAERAVFDQVIDTLLAIVVGLLAVAVVIALIGVANTLSLSVLERRRESALLRAMGLTRGELRGMLAVEGVLLAIVGVLLGAVLGLLYGWAGTAVVLGQAGEVTLAVPWVHLGAVVAVAVLAGLLASVLPARSAVRTPPVAALAAE